MSPMIDTLDSPGGTEVGGSSFGGSAVTDSVGAGVGTSTSPTCRRTTSLVLSKGVLVVADRT
jgi:hypothetical protein